MTAKLPPRNMLAGTRAEFLLRRNFCRHYLQARYLPGEDKELADAGLVFTPAGIQQLRQYLTEEALQARFVFTERLSNRVCHTVKTVEKTRFVLKMPTK